MTLTCRPTLSMCWRLWLWFGRTKKTAPNHRSHLIRVQSLRLQWTWAPLKAGRHHIQLQTTIPFIRLRVSFDGSTGTFRLTKHLTPISPDTYRLLQARPPHRHLHHEKRENGAWGCLFLKKGSDAAHLRGMRLAPSSQKDTLMLRENSNFKPYK